MSDNTIKNISMNINEKVEDNKSEEDLGKTLYQSDSSSQLSISNKKKNKRKINK